jgi:hypothetical protein
MVQPLGSKVIESRMLSDWLAGSFPLGRIETSDMHPQFSDMPRTEIWATKRGNSVGLWMWTNERDAFSRAEILSPVERLEVVDNQGNVRIAKVESKTFRIRISKIPVFVSGFPDIPQVRLTNFPNQAPVISSTSKTEAVAGSRYLYHVDGYNAEDFAFIWDRQLAVFSLTRAPEGMTIGSISGVIQWMPSEPGNHEVTVRYQDPEGLYDEQSFTIEVAPAGQNVSPYFISNPCRVAPINQEYFYVPKAVDPNGDVLTFSLDEAPAGAAINPVDGNVTWTPTESMDAVFTIRADDGKGGSAVETFHVASGVIAIRTRGGWPNAPSGLTAVSTGGGVRLTWTDNSSDDRQEKGFVIERSGTPPPSPFYEHGTSAYNKLAPFTAVHVIDADVTTYVDYPGEAGDFYYRVKAVNHISDWGGYTNIDQASSDGTEIMGDDSSLYSFFCRLSPAVFNPQSESIKIIYSIPRPGRVSLLLYDLSGRLVRRVMDDKKHTVPGVFEKEWKGKDDLDKKVSDGVYLIRLGFGYGSISKSITVLRR